MTAAAERQRAEAVPAEALNLTPTRAAARGRTSSVPADLPTAFPDGNAESLKAWPEMVREWLTVHLTAAAGREYDLVHGPPPALGRLYERHRVAASHWEAAAFRVPRLAWGLLHVAISAVLYAVLDVIASPLGAVLLFLFIVAAVNWL